LRSPQAGRGVRFVRFLALLALVVFLLASAAPALADRPMSTRFSANDNGNVTFGANSLMVCPAAAAGCTAARNTPPDLERDQHRAQQQQQVRREPQGCSGR
jgi:hypothetical protein